MRKYDTNGSGKLEREQLIKLLTDTDSHSPAGTPPTEQEVDFILKVSHPQGTDDSLAVDEIEYAMKAWGVYTSKRSIMEERLQSFDVNGTGNLSKDELKRYLESLNENQEVTDAEVDWVMTEADIFGDGKITKPELVMATAAWYGHVETKKQSSVCAIL